MKNFTFIAVISAAIMCLSTGCSSENLENTNANLVMTEGQGREYTQQSSVELESQAQEDQKSEEESSTDTSADDQSQPDLAVQFICLPLYCLSDNLVQDTIATLGHYLSGEIEPVPSYEIGYESVPYLLLIEVNIPELSQQEQESSSVSINNSYTLNSNTQVISCICNVEIKDVKSRDIDAIQAYTLFCSAENIYRINSFGINYLQCIGTKWDTNRSEYTIANEAINLGSYYSQPSYFDSLLRIEEKDFFQYDRIYIIYQLAETAGGSWSYYLSNPDNLIERISGN